MKVCKYCNREQPDEAFAVCKVVKGRVYRRLRCWRCKGLSKSQRRRDLSRWLREYKQTLRCATCGFADYRALAFHHRSGRAKELNVAETVGREFSPNRILREVAKCIVLCSNCHAIAHAEERRASTERQRIVPTAECGASDVSGLSPVGKRKVCRYCHLAQDETCFEVCKVIGNKTYRRHRCHNCKRANQLRRLGNLRAWLEGLKKTLQCVKCGFHDHRALEFHHPAGEAKDDAIGVMLKDNRSVAAVQREIAKCVVLCANCHRITHRNETAQVADVS